MADETYTTVEAEIPGFHADSHIRQVYEHNHAGNVTVQHQGIFPNDTTRAQGDCENPYDLPLQAVLQRVFNATTYSRRYPKG